MIRILFSSMNSSSLVLIPSSKIRTYKIISYLAMLLDKQLQKSKCKMIDQVINSVPIDYRYYCCGLCNSYKCLSKEIIQQATKLQMIGIIFTLTVFQIHISFRIILEYPMNQDIYFQLGVNLVTSNHMYFTKQIRKSIKYYGISYLNQT